MQPGDVNEVYLLGSQENRFDVSSRTCGFWSIEQLTAWVENDNDVLLVAEEEGRVAGYALSQYHAPTKKAVFENLQVTKEFSNRGIGRDLTLELIRGLSKKGAKYICGVFKEDNKAIQSVLEKNGFEVGKRMRWIDYSI